MSTPAALRPWSTARWTPWLKRGWMLIRCAPTCLRTRLALEPRSQVSKPFFLETHTRSHHCRVGAEKHQFGGQRAVVSANGWNDYRRHAEAIERDLVLVVAAVTLEQATGQLHIHRII